MKKFSRVEQIEVRPDDPHKYDTLGREKDCSSLLNLIRDSEPPFTLAVDAEWGNGKTVFMEMLRVHLTKKGFRSVSFNAWKCDFCEDPVAPLIVEISSELPEDSSAAKKIKSMGNKLLRVLKACGPLMPGPAPVIFNILEFVSGETEQGKSGPIEDYEQYRSTLQGFRDSLEKFASEDPEGRPLVVFIDDLDRCRPDFAVKMLERVKHIFDVASLFFVIAINKKEFGGIVKSFYGCEDGEKYLEKFFDLVFHLRNRKTLIESSLVEIRFDRFQEKVKISTGLVIGESTHRKWFGGYLQPLCGTFGFTLRVQEKLVKMLEITLDRLVHTLDEDYYRSAHTEPPQKIPSIHRIPIYLQYPLLCYFLALRIANPDLFRRSVESGSMEAALWEEHVRFYFHELGEDREMKEGSLFEMTSLRTVESEENRLIAFCLVALFRLSRDASGGAGLGVSPELKEKAEDVAAVTGIDDYFHYRFRKILASVDFAGMFYESEEADRKR